MSAPESICKLVEKYKSLRSEYKADKYNEAQLRREFLDPFFEALGWDMSNNQDWAGKWKEVIYEASVEIEGAAKAADYAFRFGGTTVFFVEAKKPSVNIESKPEPAFQLRRYGWSAKLPASVLSNFEQLAIYDCTIRPNKNDKASTSRIKLYSYSDYLEKWDEIASILQKNSVAKGLYELHTKTSKSRKGTAEVDTEFLKEIEHWREILAKNIALRNQTLGTREINHIVQLTIDRIIFLRICEDRGIESNGQIQNIANGNHVYSKFIELFVAADQRYNSGLFHLEKDKLTTSIEIDDKPLKELIKSLYYPECPYAFNYIPSDILGQVYEQFLGKVIHLTPKHQVRIEEKPEVRKAGGVYYTPTYIVDYIVDHTLGRLLLGKTPTTVQKIKICDPSCGSGSFLLVAYQYLLNWYLNWYISNDPQKWSKGKSPNIYFAHNGTWRLVSSERKKILLDHIYGVDIDPQAVEVTKLSLLLKVLEGESDESIAKHRGLFSHFERVLPDLDSNIKCGNSLISTDYYIECNKLIDDEDEGFRVNCFNWQVEFKEILKNGGFDAIMGNPPWGASFTDDDLHYLRKKYNRVINRTVDSYIYFLDKSISLVKPDRSIGFIIPSTVLNQVDTAAVRGIYLERGLTHIISLGQGIFGKGATNTSTILISGPTTSNSIHIANIADVPLNEKPIKLLISSSRNLTDWEKVVQADPHTTYFLDSNEKSKILSTLRKKQITVAEIIEGKISRGISPDIAEPHVVPISEIGDLEPGLLKPSISGKQVKNFCEYTIDQKIIYTTRETNIVKFPKILERLEPFKIQNTCREVVEKKHPWYSLHRPRNLSIFDSPKFIGLTTTKVIELVYDETNNLVVTDAMYVFKILPTMDRHVCMAILTSKIFLQLYRISNQGESRVIPQIKAEKLLTIPFPNITPKDKEWNELKQHSVNSYTLHKQYRNSTTSQGKDLLERKIESVQNGIESSVSRAYGLSEQQLKALFGD